MKSATRKTRRVLEGKVTSAKMQKSIVVEVERTFRHQKYGKYLRRRKSYLCHDEQQVAKAGDRVEITSTRPLSKNKRWRLCRIVEHGELIEASTAEGEAKLPAEIEAKVQASAQASAPGGAP